MRILHFTNYSPHRDVGAGIDRFLYWISRAQAERGHHVTVYYQGVEKQLMVHPSVELEHFFTTGNTAFRLAPALVRQVADRRYDVGHFHGAYRPSMWLLSRQFRKHGIPYAITTHGLLSPYVQQKNDRLKKLMYRSLFQLPMMNRAAFVHALSAGERDDILTYGARSPVEVIIQGFDHDHVPDPPSGNFFARFRPDWSRRCKLAFVGRIDAFHKGLDLLVSALGILREKCPEERLPIVVLAGGDYEQQLPGLQKQVNARQLERVVYFAGPLDEQDKFELLHSCDFSVLTSRFEGFPIAVVESLALGKPVLVTDSTNVGEIVRDTNSGMTVRTDVHDIVHGLRELLAVFSDRSKYSEWASNAKAAARDRFDWRIMARALDELYESSAGSDRDLPGLMRLSSEHL